MKRVGKDLIFLIGLKTFQLLVLDWRPTMETHVFLRVCGELSPHSLPSLMLGRSTGWELRKGGSNCYHSLHAGNRVISS